MSKIPIKTSTSKLFKTEERNKIRKCTINVDNEEIKTSKETTIIGLNVIKRNYHD